MLFLSLIYMGLMDKTTKEIVRKSEKRIPIFCMNFAFLFAMAYSACGWISNNVPFEQIIFVIIWGTALFISAAIFIVFVYKLKPSDEEKTSSFPASAIILILLCIVSLISGILVPQSNEWVVIGASVVAAICVTTFIIIFFLAARISK